MKKPHATPSFPTLAHPWLMVVAACLVFGYGLIAPRAAFAQSAGDMTVYVDSLQNGWQDWSWASRNLAETSIVFSGSDGIQVNFAAFTGLYFSQSAFNNSGYSAISFYVNGGTTGGQKFNIQALSNGNPIAGVPITNYLPNGIPAGKWVQVTIPLKDLGAANLNTFTGFWLQDSTGGNQPALYVDQIYLVAAPPPASVNITVNGASALQTVDERVFGLNTAGWDGNIDDSAVQTLLGAAGVRALRWPGGSWSDGTFHWYQETWPGATMTKQFAQLAGQLNAQVFVTADYGDGTPQSNAAWVAYCNALPSSTFPIGMDSNGTDWKTAGYWASLRAAAPLKTDDGFNFLRANQATPFGFKNWEFGNECYGGWENDTHTPKQDPVVYAGLAQQTEILMKQVDPSIKFGVVVTASEDDLGDQQETVTNPVTGLTHKGWTPVLFSALAGEGMVPDFVIYHNYPQNPGNESDPLLLQVPPTWTNIAASIRTMLNQYYGASAVAGVQLTCTENNSVSFNPGKQTTSLVNGLYFADSIGSLLQTEFHSLVWWDLHNGPDPNENNAAYLYGWRQYGDYGILAQAANLPGAAQDEPYPVYYTMKLLSHFARDGDTIVPAASNYANLSAYACRQQSGNLTLLVINKNAGSSVTAQFSLTGYGINGTGTEYQYGITQDTAQSQNQAVDLAQSAVTGVTNNSSLTFPAYSMSVISLSPLAAPTGLTATPGSAQVSLSWAASAGATSYNIYRATTSGGEGSVPVKAGVATTSFTDTGLTNRTTYYYVVTAVNSGGESAPSNEASATPFAPATVVFIKQDTATSGNWKGVYGADGFNIFTDTSANNPTMPAYAAATPTGNSTFQWAAPSTSNPTYCLQQAAVNSTNRLAGVWFSATSFSLDMNLTDGNAHQIALYLLDWGSAGRGETVAITDANNGNTLDTRTVTGFGNGFYEVYNISGHVKITLTKTAGNNCVLSAFFFDPKPPPPAAPTGLTATPGNQQVSLSWTASAGATSYNIYRATTSGGEGSVPVKAGVATTSFTDTGLTNGTTYYYQVTAISINGESGKSNEASATPQVVVPPAPTNLTASGGNAQVALSWTASAGATTYNVYRSTTTGAETLFQSGIATTSFMDTGLTNGTTYFYEVTAVNTAGESGKSNEASATPSAITASVTFIKQDTTTQGNWKGVYGSDGFNIFTDTSANNPTMPGYATVTPTGNSVFQWAAPAANLPNSDLQQAAVGSTNRLAGVWYSATSFSLDLNLTDGNTHQVAFYLLDFGSAGRQESIAITDPANNNQQLDARSVTSFGNGVTMVYNISGHVKITFTKSAGSNCVLSAFFFDPKPPPPAAPTGLAATPGNQQVSLSWTASAGAASYNVYRSTTSGGEGITPIKTGVTTTSFSDNTVTNGTTYYYQVTAANANGEGAKSNEASTTPSNTLATVSFVKQDTTTSGSWKGVYGVDGFNAITDPSANNPTMPGYAALTPTGNSTFQWAAPSANNATYCLQQAAANSTNRLAGVWYSATTFSMDLNLTDGNVHQISLYLLDWLSAGRGETVAITDATTNAVLDTRTVTGFGNGFYEVYNISGHVKITFIKTAGGNCVLSGFFFK